MQRKTFPMPMSAANRIFLIHKHQRSGARLTNAHRNWHMLHPFLHIATDSYSHSRIMSVLSHEPKSPWGTVINVLALGPGGTNYPYITSMIVPEEGHGLDQVLPTGSS